MKSSVLILLSLLLVSAVLAPSILTLSTIDEKAMAIDFNEEEKKEEQKEGEEKDYFLELNLSSPARLEREKKMISPIYIEGGYTASLSILLPPPQDLYS